MNTILPVYKPIGSTPLQMIDRLREAKPLYKDETIGYAGRLDPLAHGVLLLMIGEATKERDRYLHLDKTYEFEVLFGVETDTYDVLGLLMNINNKPIVNEIVNTFVNSHIGTLQQSYPPYSSKAVNGKPLFWWARNNKLSEIVIPTRDIIITQFNALSFQTFTKQQLQEVVTDRINSVSGDFRQKEILEKWNAFFNTKNHDTFITAKFRIDCSSGTYIRGIVHELGQVLGTGAIALDIKRTRVGEYLIEDIVNI